ncbi:MAG: hypothetical protein FWD69_01010 [Polyangiaceae bacterium]|nr:hypothetical protein [Polyangiaceae bacterium]
MAIAELTENYIAAEQAADEQAGQVRVGVHDASRLEWSLSLPLPAKAPVPYSLHVEIQIPQNAFVRHVPWDQMQVFTRLDGPALAATDDAVTIDALRRGALAMASQLARASDGFARHCRLAGSLFVVASRSELEDALMIWIEAFVRISQDAREGLVHAGDDELAELTRERELVDEYISVRMCEALADAERALSNFAQSKSPNLERVEPVLAVVEARLSEVLASEFAYRTERGFGNADPSSPAALERYLDRSSRLKKHFQEVLFLERESFRVEERAYHWIAGFVALLVSAGAFVWQLAISKRAGSPRTVSSSLFIFALIAGLLYAARDRIQEIVSKWMMRRVHRVYGAQRITRYRAPARRLSGRDVIVNARESFWQSATTLPDPLNPEAGATVPVTILSYVHSGRVERNASLLATDVRRVKHVFRYDLSPMFARLDDTVKPVPVLDDTSRKVRFIDAPRYYRVPIKIGVRVDGREHEEIATLIMYKRGLERLERDKAAEALPTESEIEPS